MREKSYILSFGMMFILESTKLLYKSDAADSERTDCHWQWGNWDAELSGRVILKTHNHQKLPSAAPAQETFPAVLLRCQLLNRVSELSTRDLEDQHIVSITSSTPSPPKPYAFVLLHPSSMESLMVFTWLMAFRNVRWVSVVLSDTICGSVLQQP